MSCPGSRARRARRACTLTRDATPYGRRRDREVAPAARRRRGGGPCEAWSVRPRARCAGHPRRSSVLRVRGVPTRLGGCGIDVAVFGAPDGSPALIPRPPQFHPRGRPADRGPDADPGTGRAGRPGAPRSLGRDSGSTATPTAAIGMDLDGTSRLSAGPAVRAACRPLRWCACRGTGDGQPRLRLGRSRWREFYAHVLWHNPRLSPGASARRSLPFRSATIPTVSRRGRPAVLGTRWWTPRCASSAPAGSCTTGPG